MSTESMVTQADIRAAALYWVGQKDRETFPEDLAYAEHNWRTIRPVTALAEAFARHRTAAQPESAAVALLRELRDNIGAASLARNPIGMSIRDRVDIFLRDAALTTPAPAVSTDEIVAVLQKACQFIENGVEGGYIRLPDADTPDPAHETLPAIRAILSRIRGEGE